MPESSNSTQGYFELAAEADLIMLRCSWPFDLDADEWIYIQNRYAAADYARAVDHAARSVTRTGRATGINGGLLECTRSNSGFMIEFSRPQSGWPMCSLQLHIRRPVGELAPQHLPFRVVYGRLFLSYLSPR